MEHAFITVLNMSITASYVILFVLVARVFLKKAPKIFSYSLWGFVLFRLVCPFSFSSALSFFSFFKQGTSEHIPANIGYMAEPRVDAGINIFNNWVNSSLPAAAPAASVNPMQNIIFGSSLLWIAGIIGLIAYSAISYVHLKRKVSTALLVSDNIFECENIISPFVLGFFRPKIYMPINLKESERWYIVMHEKIHIKRFDYFIKPLAFLVLCFHWFNPLVWLSFMLMSRDMEMSCDERVLKETGSSIKKDYSNSLLALAVGRRIINGSPIAFGESNVGSRIKNVLNYKKPAFWAVVVTIILVSAAGIGLMANPQNGESGLSIDSTASAAIKQDQVLIRVRGLGASIISGNEFGKFLEQTSSTWSGKKSAPPEGNSPDLTIYINIGADHKVHFYKSQPKLAAVQFKGKYRYYEIPQGTYEKLYFMYTIRSYAIPEEVMKAIADGKITNLQSVQDAPDNADYQILKAGNWNYYIYKKGGKCYIEQPYQFISEITEEAYNAAVKFADPQKANVDKTSLEIKNRVEDNVAALMSSPRQSSNPNDYIDENNDAYDNILKDGEEALSYMFSEFQKGNVKDDLRGQIMKRLCIELLGARNNVAENVLSPNDWYRRLTIRQKVDLPDFTYGGNDPVQKLVYSTEIEKNKNGDGFTVVSPHIFGSYEEGNRLKVFATTFSQQYILYDKTLSEKGGSIIPVAITYAKNEDGSYTLEKYQQAEDGTEFAKSIKDFCTMPSTGKKIKNLEDTIMEHYGNNEDIIDLQRENLIQHLKKNNQFGVSLKKSYYQEPDEIIPLT